MLARIASWFLIAALTGPAVVIAQEVPADPTPAPTPARLTTLDGVNDADLYEIYMNQPERLPAEMSDADWARIRQIKEARARGGTP